MNELYTKTATQLRQKLEEHEISVEELLNVYLNRIEKCDGLNGLNSVVELDSSAIDMTKMLDSDSSKRNLPLFGLPILVKDNIDVAGLHTTAGSCSLVDNIAKTDAPIIANLRKNGAIILGKTNMTEFANYITQDMPNGYSSRGGQVKNAYDSTIDPSGSSSGSAVAVSAGLCAAAIGTDTSFSVVGCATVNGVVGLKPSHGALSGRSIVPIAHTLDSAGALSRSFADALLIYNGMKDDFSSKIAPTDIQTLHIAINIFNRDKVSDKQLALYEHLFDRLKTAGATFSEVSHAYSPYQRDIMRYEFKHDLEDYLLSSSSKIKTLDDIVKYYETNPESMMKYGITCLRSALDETSGNLNDTPYLAALVEREKLSRRIKEDLRKYDACVMIGPTNIMHFVGLPSVALKLCVADDNTPMGIILYGADEARLFSAALTIEQYCEFDDLFIFELLK